MKEHDKVPVLTDRAPQPIGPYSQAIKSGKLVFVSGQLALDPLSGQLVGADAATQARRCLKSIEAILEMAGSHMGLIVKLTIFMVDLNEFAAVNKVCEEVFPFQPPARSTVQVAALPKGGRVEIEAIAALKIEEGPGSLFGGL